MGAVYIISDKGKLTKESEKLVFIQYDGAKRILFPFNLDLLVLIGSVSLSGDAFRLLSKHKIPVVFLSGNGNFNGKLVYLESKNVFLRQKQYLISADEKQNLETARMIVTGKIKNQISFIQKIKRKQKSDDKEIRNAVGKIKNILEQSFVTDNLNSLRSYEAVASKIYFSVYRLNIIPEWALFPRRSRNPPETNVNAVLSFLYALLCYRVEAAIESSGLDPMAGSLHVMNYGSLSLVFDLMEEFRTPIADTLCAAVFNKGTITESDFREEVFSVENEDYPLDADSNVPEKKGILLNKEGLKKVISAFENKLSANIFYPLENKKLSYQQIIFAQVQQYKRYISGEQKEYISFYGK